MTRGKNSIQKKLSKMYLFVWGSKKQQRREQDYSNFTKGEIFFRKFTWAFI